jgi:hypothetical protein
MSTPGLFKNRIAHLNEASQQFLSIFSVHTASTHKSAATTFEAVNFWKAAVSKLKRPKTAQHFFFFLERKRNDDRRCGAQRPVSVSKVAVTQSTPDAGSLQIGSLKKKISMES